MLGLQCRSGPGQRGASVLEPPSSFPDISFSRITARWGWRTVGELMVHFYPIKEKETLLQKGKISAAPIRVSKLMCLLPKFLRLSCESTSSLLFSKSTAAGNHHSVYLQSPSEVHDSSVPSPNWAVLAPSYHTPAPSLWLSVDLSEIQANGGKERPQDAHVLVLDAPWMTSSSLLLLKWMTEIDAL